MNIELKELSEKLNDSLNEELTDEEREFKKEWKTIREELFEKACEECNAIFKKYAEIEAEKVIGLYNKYIKGGKNDRA